MRKQAVIAAVGIGLLVAVGLLYWRVRVLEQTVQTLNPRLSSHGTVVSLQQPAPPNSEPKQQVFKLIDTAPTTSTPGTTKIGVPWSVERAMIGGANEGVAPIRDETTWQTTPVEPTPNLVPAPPDSK
jgi:hypothetical protein